MARGGLLLEYQTESVNEGERVESRGRGLGTERPQPTHYSQRPSRFERLRKNTVERTFRGRDLEHFGDGLEVFHAFLPVRRVIERLVHGILRT